MMLDTDNVKVNKMMTLVLGSAGVLAIRNIVLATDADHVRNLTFYSGHILKSQKKQRKLILILYFI